MVHRVRSVKSTHIGHPDFIQYCLFYYFRFKKKQIATQGHRKPKPNWVKREIIRIKAHMPKAGCRLIADVFNRSFAVKEMTVGKSFVYSVLRDNIYEVESLRKKWKRRVPKPMAKKTLFGVWI